MTPRSRRILFVGNALSCVANLTLAFTTGDIPCFFIGGLNGLVALLLWP